MKKLSELSLDKTAKIIGFSNKLNLEFINDIMDHGLIIGSSITVLGNLSDKIILNLGYSNISIRKKDAEQIFIDNMENYE